MEETTGFVSARDALAALEQYQGCFFPHSAAVKIINQLSREDVEPVVYGRWENITGGMVVLGDCSECKARQPVIGTNYCPNCGAKMDREES
jgi:hypothetical protein